MDLHERFSSATVAICGLGGLGSNIAIALARAGIGRLILIDFDRVDITNLHRQQYKASQIGKYKTEALTENLLEIAPYIQTNTIRTRNITKHFYLCGDGVSAAEDTIGLVAPRVMLCAAHQAQTVLRILAGEFEV